MSHGAELFLPKGFQFAAVKAGIKASGSLDFAIAEAPLGASAAALFTTNLVCAAPVVVGKDHLAKTRGRIRAVVVNAGNANCATGKPGYEAALDVCREAARRLEVAPEFILPSSTGIIGVPLPVQKLAVALPALLAGRHEGEQGVQAFSRAIMTTDTRPKLASVRIKVRGKIVSLLGVAKGSGMIHPNLATMLVYIFTDIEAAPAELKSVLRQACRTTFNRITVDGDTSTNDTVLLMGSGRSGIKLRDSAANFSKALLQICRSLADQIVADGEGVKHVVNLTVEGARTEQDADSIARTVAHSMLNKTAWAGADPNWGRIIAATGRSGVKIDPSNVDVFIGPHQVCRAGGAVEFDPNAAHEVMLQPRYDLRVRVGTGKGRASVLTCDLTAEYVHINADYST